MKDKINLFFLLLSAIFVLLIVFVVPPNMDEFGQYSPLACFNTKKFSYYDYTYPCNGVYSLLLFGKNLMLRSYSYLGLTKAIFYAPVYFLWRSYFSARLLNVVYLILFAFFFKKISNLKWFEVCSLTFLFFPISFQFVVDTSPVCFHLFAAMTTVYLLKTLKYDSPVYMFLLLGLLSFLAVWDKMTYYWMVPGLVAILIFFGFRNTKKISGDNVVLYLIKYAEAFFTMFFPLSLLVSAKVPTGETYIEYQMAQFFSRAQGETFLPRILSHFTNAIFPYFASFSNFAHRIYAHEASEMIPLDYPTLLFWINVLILVFCLLNIYLKNKDKKLVESKSALFVYLFGFLSTLFLVSGNKDSWAGHHVILSFPFLILVLAEALNLVKKIYPKVSNLFIIFMLLINVLLLYENLSREPFLTEDWSKVEILKYLKKEGSDKALVIAPDWGAYYIFLLYGNKNHLVSDPDHLSIDKLSKLESLMYANSVTKMYFVMQSRYVEGALLVKGYFPSAEVVAYPGYTPSSKWILLVYNLTK